MSRCYFPHILQINSFILPESSLSFSQENDTNSVVSYKKQAHILSRHLMSVILILFSHLRSDLPCGLFLQAVLPHFLMHYPSHNPLIRFVFDKVDSYSSSQKITGFYEIQNLIAVFTEVRR